MFTFHEFFAGGGMARAGLGPTWQCLFANDFDYKKSDSYAANWGSQELLTADVKNVSTADIPGQANLAWASFPCQDLSLAGGGAGLRGERSGTFWPFWKLLQRLSQEGRKPDIIVLENVCGAITSHRGKDFSTICQSFEDLDYCYGAIVIDARLFVPQSRPRLFVIGVNTRLSIPALSVRNEPSPVWHTKNLVGAHNQLKLYKNGLWRWWNIPTPPAISISLQDIIEHTQTDVSWNSRAETNRLLTMMSKINITKIERIKEKRQMTIGTVYKRTRLDDTGSKLQRAEVRFDGIAGCLRTPSGGSSRQTLLFVNGDSIKSRLVSRRETARLMGLPDSYILPEKYNEAYHLTGDGVVVPVVGHLARSLLEPLLKHNYKTSRAAA